MNARRWTTTAMAAVLVVSLAGCDQDGDGVDDQTGKPVTGVTPTRVAPEDFPTRDTSGPPPEDDGLFGCDQSGWGPLSGCDSTPINSDASWPGAGELSDILDDSSPGGVATWIVTDKYHADGKNCVEFRVPSDPRQRFQRVCVPDEVATDQDRYWLDHQVVGQPKWAGGAR